ncbi:hypothetical protein HYC85_014347 [Camellia sinensis]|uniref:Uncharacterized protein n=1 Tax=Camellia sinensis TaxID=4442 RepID=A0A7J7H5Z1_CAMSI|nr:hypothetical protein HYC85_014347 [Camellia sinensis]
MSVLQYPEAMNASDLQVWNNAAFDNGDSEDIAIIRSSWSPLKPILVNQSESFDSLSSKENQSPVPEKSHHQSRPLHPNGIIGNSQENPPTTLLNHSLIEKTVFKNANKEVLRDEKKIDAEIEEIQMEITRLSSKLEALRLEKAEQKLKLLERRRRVVPAKFMEPKLSVKNAEKVKKIEEPSSMSARTKLQRRGLSLGPSEIVSGARRGIFSMAKSKQLGGKQEIITPVQPIQNRRKSCFWKLQDIDEEKVTKERGKSSSVSPKSRKMIPKTQFSRQAVTTVGSKKAVKKEDGVLSTIHPKKLFKDGEKSVPAKKPLKPGRIVASRYNQSATGNSAMRKRSLPENDKEDGKRCDKKRSSSSSESILEEKTQNQDHTETRVKKQWEIPGEVVIHRGLKDDDDEETPVPAAKIPEMLPRIRAVRYQNDSPRDSGPAKRVAQLIGRKSYFRNDDEDEEAPVCEAPVCQALSFVEEDVEEK